MGPILINIRKLSNVSHTGTHFSSFALSSKAIINVVLVIFKFMNKLKCPDLFWQRWFMF